MKKLRGVCLDIDETLSTHGKLTAEAFQALWKLKKKGWLVVPVTGRPAGWCDHIARFWPVDAVVGENGAFTFYMEEGVRKRIDTPMKWSRAEAKRKLEELGRNIQSRFPGVKWASDQAYREYDLAVDFCEDVPPWTKDQVGNLVRLCESEGAHAKVSSIHVNVWFGDYDKSTGLKHWLKEGAPGAKVKSPLVWNDLVFIGDSPNDEPLFRAFETSVGVANLKNFLSDLQFPPPFITSRESGAGFAEFVRHLTSFQV